VTDHGGNLPPSGVGTVAYLRLATDSRNTTYSFVVRTYVRTAFSRWQKQNVDGTEAFVP
jgi:hypothetical protein